MVQCTFGSHLGLTCSCSSSSGSVSGGASRHAQSSLKAIVKDGGRAEKRRVWKLRVYEENTVAPSLRKAGWRRVIETMPANSLFRRCPRFIPFHQTWHKIFQLLWWLADLVWVSTDESYRGDETTCLKTNDVLVYLVFNQVKVLPHILWWM